MATQLTPAEQLFKVIKEGASAKKPSPEEQLFKVIKEGSQVANAASPLPPPAASTVKLEVKQSPDAPPVPPATLKVKQAPLPPPVPPAKTDAKPSLSGSGVVAAAAPIVLPKVPPKAESAEKPASSSPSSLWGSFKGAAQALAVRHASGAQYFAVFRRIEVINRSLAIVLVMLLGGFIYFAAMGRPSIKKTVAHFPRPPARSMKADNHEAFMSSEEYVKMSKQRDIFSREQRAAAERPAVADKPGSLQTKTDLKLVGIYFSEQPEVIIEDKVEKKTYFLKEGEKIKEIKVKSIRQDRVILESDGMDWELM